MWYSSRWFHVDVWNIKNFENQLIFDKFRYGRSSVRSHWWDFGNIKLSISAVRRLVENFNQHFWVREKIYLLFDYSYIVPGCLVWKLSQNHIFGSLFRAKVLERKKVWYRKNKSTEIIVFAIIFVIFIRFWSDLFWMINKVYSDMWVW